MVPGLYAVLRRLCDFARLVCVRVELLGAGPWYRVPHYSTLINVARGNALLVLIIRADR